MKKRIISLLCALSIGCGAVGCDRTEEIYDPLKREAMNKNETSYTFSEVETYKNHMEIEGQWGANSGTGPTGQYGIGDPFIMRFNGSYYLYPSTADHLKGVKVFQSRDMFNWEYKGYAIDPSEDTSVTSYAPEVVYYEGSFFMCQSQGGNGHYFYRSNSPLGPFELISDNLGKGIDGAFHLADDGRLYFMHTSVPGGLRAAELTHIGRDAHLDEIGNSVEMSNANLRGWIEGPGIIRRGDYSYFTYTGNHVISGGYRVAYSYAKDLDGFSDFIQPENNVLLISTKSDFRGLGHSSNAYGADLDSMYTAYHNLVDRGPARRYNLDRLMGSGGYLMTNGVTNYDVAVPSRPNFETDNEQGLIASESKFLSENATESNFTAEFNFVPTEDNGIIFSYVDEDNFSVLSLNKEDDTLILKQIKNGTQTQIAAVSIGENNDYSKTNIIRIEKGYAKTHIYYNNMRKITTVKAFSGGKIGYEGCSQIQYTAFSNEVFGTSDFETVKNLPTGFPSTAYLKTENRGFFIKNAKPKADGVRQGEKENTKQIGDEFAVVLDTKNDYVKYAVNASAQGHYALSATVDSDSVGSICEVVVDETDIYKFVVPAAEFSKGLANVPLTGFDLSKGKHTLKIRLFSGKLTATAFKAAIVDTTSELKLDLTTQSESFLIENGSYSFGSNGVTSTDSAISYATIKGTKLVDFELSVDIVLNTTSMNTEGGIAFRSNNFSYYSAQPTQAFQGYLLSVQRNMLVLYKYDYGDTLIVTKGIASGGVGLFANQAKHTVTIKAKSNIFSIYIDGELKMEGSNARAFCDGDVALFSKNASLTYSKLSVKSI